MLHKIREERAKERAGLSVEEEVRLDNEIAEKFAKEHGLEIYKPPEKSYVSEK